MFDTKPLLSLESIKQASNVSIYIDACFILSFLDEDDYYSEKIADMIDAWAHQGNIVGISTHTFAEVVNVLLKHKIERSLEVYILNKDNLETTGLSCLTAEEILDLINLESAKFFYQIYNDNNEDRAYKIIKRAKKDRTKKHLINVYYERALSVYQEFLYSLEEYFDIKIEILSSREEEHQAALQYMSLFQLETHDAVHFSIAKNYNYEYFITLDGDFNHIVNSLDPTLKTKIIRIVA
jgi:predicted nucleic acid-binding protein